MSVKDFGLMISISCLVRTVTGARFDEVGSLKRLAVTS